MIISASRRTDIPAFYGEWMVNRLRAGCCLVANPFNPRQAIKDLTLILSRDAAYWTSSPLGLVGAPLAASPAKNRGDSVDDGRDMARRKLANSFRELGAVQGNDQRHVGDGILWQAGS